MPEQVLEVGSICGLKDDLTLKVGRRSVRLLVTRKMEEHSIFPTQANLLCTYSFLSKELLYLGNWKVEKKKKSFLTIQVKMERQI